MPGAPLISAIMPVRNLGRYVGQAVESVLTQTFTDFEFLIVDDGSTDDTGRIIADYARRDSRIRILPGPRDGISKALNLALREARGALIARMDGDDRSLPRRFERQAAFLEQHPDHVLVGCRCTLIDPAGRPICNKPDTELTHEEIEPLLLGMKWPLVHPAVMARASAIARVGGYNETYRICQDHDLFLRLAEIGKLANLPEVLLLYRQNFRGSTLSATSVHSRQLVHIITEACARRGIPVPPETIDSPPHPISQVRHRRNWIWWALAAGNKATARHHATAVLLRSPFSMESWKAALCALRGR